MTGCKLDPGDGLPKSAPERAKGSSVCIVRKDLQIQGPFYHNRNLTVKFSKGMCLFPPPKTNIGC